MLNTPFPLSPTNLNQSNLKLCQFQEQYNFLYTAVNEYLSTKDFAYSPDKIHSLIAEFKEEESTNNITREYQVYWQCLWSVFNK